ncbi:hypothetical protein NW768_008642 [Fusarium equiseti]|uniref:Uncharacterized protein n=1 Tax=Fusarium equiseti TaxID=61235 RepID=A0ABQ8R4Z4_FUSEQ|nr:hypothetical protein NW768_008642 [Fusarium equiseti]
MSAIMTTIDNNPFDAKVGWDSPFHQRLKCFARCLPHIYAELVESNHWDDLDGAARFLAHLSPKTQYLVQRAQTANLITGGKTINTLAEYVTTGVSHGLAPQNTMDSIEHSVVELVQNIVNKHNFRFEPFEEDNDYGFFPEIQSLARKPRKQGSSAGTLNLQVRKKYSPAKSSPTSGRVWNIFAGTVSHKWGRKSQYVVPTPRAMAENTDARHYQNESKSTG